ncbi:hypothetical protein B0O80DRAFT_467839 [Mortierella sp. GBAus27b]|nr:hypothetical protein B0O80DRAFT_467839 [Mortierella sp. GBAus27b]
MCLWKGQFTNWVYEMLYLFAQPTLEATLNDTFDLYDDTIPLVHLDPVGPNIATMATSHLYTGTFDCITTIIQEEGISTLWGGVNMYPTLVYHTLTPLLSNSILLIIDRVFKLSTADSPVLYALAELSLNMLDLLI